MTNYLRSFLRARVFTSWCWSYAVASPKIQIARIGWRSFVAVIKLLAMNSNPNSNLSQYKLIAAAINYLHEHANNQPTLEQLALQLKVSPFHLQRVFSDWAGISPKRFLQFLTKQHAHDLLRAQNDVLTTSITAGLSGPSRLHDLMVTCEAMTPGEIRAGGKDLTIQAGYSASRLGRVLVATTERGICHLEFIDDGVDDVMERLRGLWPNAKLERNDAQAASVVDIAIEQLAQAATPTTSRPLHLLLSGTNFQIQVWQALLNIPQGATTTYGQIGAALGRPNSQRAIGGAVGANTLAILIPCHRVIRGDGDLSGYRWGCTRKAALLALESARSERVAA